ncbi:MAG: hypothetical protein R3C04_03780 [Hyphomonas sp.]
MALPVTVSEPEHARSDLLPDADAPHAGATKPSIAILPFRLVGVAGAYAPLVEALPHDLDHQLVALRWLFVIARGSSFRLADRPDPAQIRSVLGVAYCLSGVIEIVGTRMAVSVELADMRTGGVIWSERYAGDVGNIHEVREQTSSRTSSRSSTFISCCTEAGKARLGADGNISTPGRPIIWVLCTCSASRGGIMNRPASCSRTLCPRIRARARAGVGPSFTRFQNAFLRYTPDIAAEITGARDAAERGWRTIRWIRSAIS